MSLTDPSDAVPLAKLHTGMRANGRRFLCEDGRGYAGMRREMAKHLDDLAKGYYAGNVAIVDEFLQLYCFGEKEREALLRSRAVAVNFTKK